MKRGLQCSGWLGSSQIPSWGRRDGVSARNQLATMSYSDPKFCWCLNLVESEEREKKIDGSVM